MDDRYPDIPADRQFDTPEEAAVAGFDPRFARVVEVSYKDETHAVVELSTNEPPVEYPYFVRVERVRGRWVEIASHN